MTGNSSGSIVSLFFLGKCPFSISDLKHSKHIVCARSNMMGRSITAILTILLIVTIRLVCNKTDNFLTQTTLQTIYQHQLLVLPMSMFPAIVFQHYTWQYLQACCYLLYTVLVFIMINVAH